MSNVIDFMKYKRLRDEVYEEIEREDLMEFLMNLEDYKSGTFTYTLTVEDYDD